MIHRYEMWHDGKGNSVGQLIAHEPDALSDLPRFFTQFTLRVQTTHGIEEFVKRLPIQADSLEEAFGKIPTPEDVGPQMEKEYLAMKRQQQKPKIELPGGFIANNSNNGFDHNRMKFPAG